MSLYKRNKVGESEGFGPGSDLVMSLFIVVFMSGILALGFFQLQSVWTLLLQRSSGLDPFDDNLPPVISLPEAAGFTFATGSGRMSSAFKRELHLNMMPRIEELASRHHCDVLEIYGFTDGQVHLSRQKRTKLLQGFDGEILKKLRRRNSASLLTASNVELGMLRAAKVASWFRDQQRKFGRLAQIKHIRPFSGGQILLPSGELASYPDNADSNEHRRRIVLRLSRSAQTAEQASFTPMPR